MPDPVEGEEVLAETPPEEKHDGFIALDKHQKDVNVQHKKFRDEERGRVKAEERASTVEKELEKLRTKQAEVVIPPVPDRYSETFDADIQTRDTAIKKQADQDAEQTRLADERKTKDEARITEENAAMNEKVVAFDSNMVTHGLNPAETKKAADTVIGYGISTNFQDVLLEDPDGPLLVTYLAQNPVELEEMNRMSVLQLVNHLNGDIRQKASLLKPQTSNAPNPPTTIKGGGASEMEDPLLKGAKFE